MASQLASQSDEFESQVNERPLSLFHSKGPQSMPSLIPRESRCCSKPSRPTLWDSAPDIWVFFGWGNDNAQTVENGVKKNSRHCIKAIFRDRLSACKAAFLEQPTMPRSSSSTCTAGTCPNYSIRPSFEPQPETFDPQITCKLTRNRAQIGAGGSLSNRVLARPSRTPW